MSNNWIALAAPADVRSQFAALLQEIDVTLAQASQIAPLKNTLQELKQFGEDFFGFFAEAPAIERFAALGKIQREWLTLRPVFDQRQQPHLATRLAAADAIAADCVRQFDVVINTQDHECLIYFEKVYSMARFAYSRMPSLSIPLSSAQDPWLWLGLCHELGHYYYWNQPGVKGELDKTLLRDLSAALSERLQATPSLNAESAAEQLTLWPAWLEEAFADVFDAVIFGPASIESLMLWLTQRLAVENLLTNDNDHPLPILRPLLQIEALSLILTAPEAQRDLQDLRAAWEEQWAAAVPIGLGENWRTRRIGKTTVQTCIDLLPVIAHSILSQLPRRPYTDTFHTQVKQLAQTDLAGLPSDVFLALPVAWYAWRDAVAQLEADAAQVKAQAVRSWVDRVVAQPPKTIARTVTPSAQMEPLTFKRWREEIAREVDPQDVSKRLLASEFTRSEGMIFYPCYVPYCQWPHYHGV